MNDDILAYHLTLTPEDREIVEILAYTIDSVLKKAENKIWHGHPVWFLDGNPIVGYSRQKKSIRLMFWSGAGFEEEALNVKGDKFKDASIFYQSGADINTKDLKRWLQKSKTIQWDYKNIVKKKGRLDRLR